MLALFCQLFFNAVHSLVLHGAKKMRIIKKIIHGDILFVAFIKLGVKNIVTIATNKFAPVS